VGTTGQEKVCGTTQISDLRKRMVELPSMEMKNFGKTPVF
jgi:hypothetical protein